MNNAETVVITGSARTPIGDFSGCLSPCSATQLGAVAIKGALMRCDIKPHQIDEILMGCVLTAGLGQAPTRQASLTAGIPPSVGCTTINKMCGSGMKAIMLAHDLIQAGSAKIVVAGGMESMSNAPYLLSTMRSGQHLGHNNVFDHLLKDGLEDYKSQRLMGCYAEDCAEKFSFSRSQQDEFASLSLTRAQRAIHNMYFNDEIEPVIINSKLTPITIDQDERPLRLEINKISQLKPAFKTNGTVTAANSSGIADGAAAVVLMSESEATKRHITPLARIIGHQSHAQKTTRFTTAPILAIEKLLKQQDLTGDEIDLFEINEAFAVVVMAAIQTLHLDINKVNIHGGACALGHPIGASGARIIVTLLSALQQYNLKRGLAALCIGGGEATAMLISK